MVKFDCQRQIQCFRKDDCLVVTVAAERYTKNHSGLLQAASDTFVQNIFSEAKTQKTEL